MPDLQIRHLPKWFLVILALLMLDDITRNIVITTEIWFFMFVIDRASLKVQSHTRVI